MAIKVRKPGKLMNRILKATFFSFLCRRLNVEADIKEIKDLKGPYLLFANHTTNWDPFLMAGFITQPVQFLTSDTHFRSRFLKFVLTKLVGAIPKTKSMSDAFSVKQVMKVVKRNGIIGVFPEGARNWDGKTGDLIYSTAKLVKLLNIPVVTCVFKGAYMTRPRWTSRSRRGKIELEYKLIIKDKQAKELHADKIFSLLTKSLYHNEYEWQKNNMIYYKSKKPAENLELFLYACPSCSKFNTMSSKHDIFSCTNCGYTVKLNNYGFFEAFGEYKDLYFSDPEKWGVWQQKKLSEFINDKSKSGEYIFKASNVTFKQPYKGRRIKKIDSGELVLYKDKLIFTSLKNKETVLKISKINGANVQLNYLFEFYYEKKLYRYAFGNKRRISAYMWVSCIKYIKK